jgi:hypothetical protein
MIFVSWLSITIAKFGILYFSIIKAIDDVFYIKDYRKLIIPVSILIPAIAILVYKQPALFCSPTISNIM